MYISFLQPGKVDRYFDISRRLKEELSEVTIEDKTYEISEICQPKSYMLRYAGVMANINRITTIFGDGRFIVTMDPEELEGLTRERSDNGMLILNPDGCGGWINAWGVEFRKKQLRMRR